MDLNGEKRVFEKMENNLKEIFEEIGKKFYSTNKDNEIAKAEYKELFDKVQAVFDEKNKMEVRMLAKQGKRRCGGCETLVALESRFCNMCGAKLEELPANLFEQEEKQPEVRKCSKCGTVLEKDAVFCPNCGQKNA